MSFSSLIFIALFLPVFMIASVLVRGNQRKNLVLLSKFVSMFPFSDANNSRLVVPGTSTV